PSRRVPSCLRETACTGSPIAAIARSRRTLGGTSGASEVIEAICRIASACRKDSLVGAITKTGYFDASDALELESISRYLKEHPNLIDDWLTYSGDKRSAPSWYFRRAGDGRYEVGFFPKEKPTF